MTDFVLHDTLAHAPWLDPALWRLPGVKPLDEKDWIVRDEAFAGQMRLRDRLIATLRHKVHAVTPRAIPPARECLDLMLDALAADSAYRRDGDSITRPDGVTISIDRDAPFLTMGRLTQSDVCMMQEGPDGHVLTGAILCFPASWTLSEKIGRPLMGIHEPVPAYDANIGQRVQRLFDAIRPDRPMWRANAHRHQDPVLYHPRSEADPPEVRHDAPGGPYLRSERQVLRRLRETGAVVFTIHTTMIPVDRLSARQQAGLESAGLKAG